KKRWELLPGGFSCSSAQSRRCLGQVAATRLAGQTRSKRPPHSYCAAASLRRFLGQPAPATACVSLRAGAMILTRPLAEKEKKPAAGGSCWPCGWGRGICCGVCGGGPREKARLVVFEEGVVQLPCRRIGRQG